jgi:hypothetical protein
MKFRGIRTNFQEILRFAISAGPGNRSDWSGLSLTVSHNLLACSGESGSIILINVFGGVTGITGRKKGRGKRGGE